MCLNLCCHVSALCICNIIMHVDCYYIKMYGYCTIYIYMSVLYICFTQYKLLLVCFFWEQIYSITKFSECEQRFFISIIRMHCFVIRYTVLLEIFHKHIAFVDTNPMLYWFSKYTDCILIWSSGALCRGSECTLCGMKCCFFAEMRCIW